MRSTSRAPPFTEKWFWFKADPQRTGAYAYASERVHSISFICRIIAVFLFAAQGRANARVHQLKVSSSALHRGCEASAILSPRLDARLCSSFLFWFPSSKVSCARAIARSAPILPLERREERDPFIFLFSSQTGEKIYHRKSIERKEGFFFFSDFICFIESWKVSFLRLYLIILEKFSYFSSFLLLLFFSK